MVIRRSFWFAAVLSMVLFVCSVQGPAFAGHRSPPPSAGGDEPSTFGHQVIYLGLLTSFILFDPTCAPGAVTPPDVCVVIQPAPGPTAFSFPNLRSMVLPANSTRDIVLPSLTYNLFYDLLNTTSVSQTGIVKLVTTITIVSPVLNLPTLINPNTGLPYDGTFPLTFGGPRNTLREMAPGEDFKETYRGTGDGIEAGTREALLGANLPPNVVNALFQQPMTIQIGISGNVQLLDTGALNFGARFFGDK